MTWYGLLQVSAETGVQPRDTSTLTSRELQIVQLIAAGMSNKQIAHNLGIAVHTVKSHVHNVLLKLELNTRLEVAVMVHAGDRAVRLAQVRLVEEVEQVA